MRKKKINPNTTLVSGTKVSGKLSVDVAWRWNSERVDGPN